MVHVVCTHITFNIFNILTGFQYGCEAGNDSADCVKVVELVASMQPFQPSLQNLDAGFRIFVVHISCLCNTPYKQ